jgi:hypothetical protein
MENRTGLPDAWPLGKSLAASVTIMLDGWTGDSAPGIGPMGYPLQAGVLDLQARSWADYGPKEGAWRILDVLRANEVRAVWYVSGIIAELYAPLVRAIAEEGHVVACHGWAQNILPVYQTAEQEVLDLRRSAKTLMTASGQRPRGWLSPRCTPSSRTTQLLLKAGFHWQADTFNSGLPYLLKTTDGSLVAMPFTTEVNDLPLYVRYGNEPEMFTRVLRRIVQNWPQIGNMPGCLDITIHAHVFGRPFGLIEFVNALEIVDEARWAWLTDHANLTEIYRV